jgi:hypothetical protein
MMENKVINIKVSDGDAIYLLLSKDKKELEFDCTDTVLNINRKELQYLIKWLQNFEEKMI